MIYPGDLVVSALRLAPDMMEVEEWRGEPTNCSHCARPIAAGSLYQSPKLGEFFSDTRDLACASGVVCWQCTHLRKKTMLNGLSFTLVTKDAIYPIAKHENKAWLFLTPPAGPFLALHSSATMQHLAWRTPVTLDNNLINIRFGPRLYTVRPAVVRKGVEIADRINMNTGKSYVNPLMLDQKAMAFYHGLINPKARELLTDQEVDFLTNIIRPGERWALSFLTHSKRPQPVMPDPITDALREKHLK